MAASLHYFGLRNQMSLKENREADENKRELRAACARWDIRADGLGIAPARQLNSGGVVAVSKTQFLH